MSFFGNSDSFNARYNFRPPDQRTEILAWLSPLDQWIRHKDVQSYRVPGVGDWLLRTDGFRNWRDALPQDKSRNTTFFCYGNPGVGKTCITSLVIDTLGGQVDDQNIIVACFYFDFATQKAQSPTDVLGALLKQVVSGLGEIPEEIVQAYYKHRKVLSGRRPELSEILTMIQTVFTSQRIYICIDALDECVAEHRQVVLGSLQEILKKSPGTRLFLTGRSNVQSEIRRLLAETVAFMDVKPDKRDIMTYILSKLEKDTNKDAMSLSLRTDILKKIPDKVSEMFLSVSLIMEAILKEQKVSTRRDRLEAMTTALKGAYDRMLDRVKAQGKTKEKIGTTALMWVSHSERPLKVDELCHALAVEIGSEDLNLENVPSIETLLECCQGLVVVDKEASTVRLIHSTLHEYLSTCPGLFDRAHSTIAGTCLTYLNFKRFKGHPTSDLSDRVRIPFLGYSSIYWGIHAKRELSDCTKLLALKLFSDYDDHISIKILLEHVSDPGRLGDSRGFSPFTGLHCASFFGIVDVVAALVEVDGCDVNRTDCLGNTPLIWAAGNGHEGVVELLLERRDIKPDGPDEYGRTPLSRAAESGHEGAASLLLRRDDANPDRPDDRGQTPLSWAARNGHDGLVKLLLIQNDVNPDRLGFDGRAPLSWAAGGGREGVVKLLLERCDVNPDQPDYEGLAPLLWAVKNGQEGVVKLLLGRSDVNPDRPDTIFGQTPLSLAAENGHEGVVKLLLERSDVEPDRPDTILGHTPLLWAAENGYEGVVKLLLERKDVNPDRQGFDGRTPLLGAAWNGYEGVVKLLLGRGDVNPDRPDTEGQAPLSCAARNGYEGVVKLLLGRGDVNPNRPDTEGQTPLSWAFRNGHEGVAKLLLSREDVDPDRPDTEGQTPLSGAVKRGDEGAANLPQKRRDSTPDVPDRSSHMSSPPYTTGHKRSRLAL